MNEIFILLIVFQIKHLIADFPLQNEYMLGKFKRGKDFILPLAAHAGVHFVFTFFIVFFFKFDIMLALTLALFDFFTHFIIDRIKASPDLLGRWIPSQKMFWNMIGVDQMCHHLVHYSIIYFM